MSTLAVTLPSRFIITHPGAGCQYFTLIRFYASITKDIGG